MSEESFKAVFSSSDDDLPEELKSLFKLFKKEHDIEQEAENTTDAARLTELNVDKTINRENIERTIIQHVASMIGPEFQEHMDSGAEVNVVCMNDIEKGEIPHDMPPELVRHIMEDLKRRRRGDDD